MPVPGGTFKAKVLVRCEMPALESQGNKQQHQHADEDVKAVKTCQHEKCRTVDARCQFQIQVVVGMVILIALNN